MHRSLLCLLRRQSNVCSFVNDNVWSAIQTMQCPPPTLIALRKSVHTSPGLRSGEDADEEKAAKKSSTMNKNLEQKQLHLAAVNAARSLPGDWTRTADELMQRLSLQADKAAEPSEHDQPPSTTHSSLLSKMKIGRSFVRPKTDMGFSGRGRDNVVDKHMLRKRLAKKNEFFTSLYSQPRLGIFDAEKLKTQGKGEEDKEDSLWHVVTREKMERCRGDLPRNGFEEMIQWTKKGRMWTFPVDNEEDLDEERQYKFHEHVFLNHHLKAFPSDGPLRRFMDLVVLGLSKNPWLTVPEKVEHIEWYTNYFQEKQKLLKSSMGDKAILKGS